jgi:hypothetical protein
MTNYPLMFGQLNDGRESQFPVSDVKPLMAQCQGAAFCELTDRVDQVLPGYITCQGPVDDPDKSALGIALDVSLFVQEGAPVWVDLTQDSRHPALLVRAKYQGTKMSIISTKRPSLAHADLWPEFDRNLKMLLRSERANGRFETAWLDANEKGAIKLELNTSRYWAAPFEDSMVGGLVHGSSVIRGSAALPSHGEHAPVLVWLKVPVS